MTFRDFHRGLENRWLFYSWFGVLVLVASAWLFGRSSVSTTFLGVAQSRQVEIRHERPVKIKYVRVVPGQRVKRGETLVELDQQELIVKLNNTRMQLAQLKAQWKLNESLAAQLSRGIEAHQKPSENPAALEIRRVEDEVRSQEKQLVDLVVVAPFDGIVGGVSFAAGETVSPFTPILTLSKIAPATIQGFIEESALSSAHQDVDVTVTSLTDSRKSVTGTITTLGTRIVPFPERLVGIQGLSLWGREVLVTIADESPFLVGEKVRVTMGSGGLLLPAANAALRKKKGPLE